MGDYRPERPVFCGNFEYDAAEREIEKLFERYGDVDKIDMKTGFAFIYMRDKRDAEVAIRKLDGETFGYKRRRLRVEWATHPEEPKRDNVKPKTTLFVVNFDARRTYESDLARYFSKWGRLVRTEIKKNYAFVQYERLEDAIDAQRDAHQREFMGRRLSVEYVANDDPHAAFGRGRSPPPRRRSRSRSPRQRSRSPMYDRRRSRSASPKRRSISPRRRSFSDSPRRRRSASPMRRSPSPRPRSRSRSPYTRPRSGSP